MDIFHVYLLSELFVWIDKNKWKRGLVGPFLTTNFTIQYFRFLIRVGTKLLKKSEIQLSVTKNRGKTFFLNCSSRSSRLWTEPSKSGVGHLILNGNSNNNNNKAATTSSTVSFASNKRRIRIRRRRRRMMQKISVGQLFTQQHFSLRVASNNNDLGSGCASVGRGHLWHQRSVVRIQSSANFYQSFLFFQLCWKDVNKEKRGQEMPVIWPIMTRDRNGWVESSAPSSLRPGFESQTKQLCFSNWTGMWKDRK